jgi:hypothetical protein
MSRLLIIFLLAIAPLTQAAEEVCGYCIQASELALSPKYNQIYVPAPDGGVGSIQLNVEPAEAVIRDNHVCTGPVTQLLPPKEFGAPQRFNLFKIGGIPQMVMRPHLRVCDGTLVPLDEYRLKPFKDFGQVLVTGERKEFMARVNSMAKNVEPDKVEAMLRKLLEEKDGPLAKQRAALVTETTDSVVKLISTAKPKKN